MPLHPTSLDGTQLRFASKAAATLTIERLSRDGWRCSDLVEKDGEYSFSALKYPWEEKRKRKS
jgi:hypothetical protein